MGGKEFLNNSLFAVRLVNKILQPPYTYLDKLLAVTCGGKSNNSLFGQTGKQDLQPHT